MKLRIYLLMFFVVPLFSMHFTPKDNVDFAEAIVGGLEYDNKMIQQSRLSECNAMHMTLKKLFDRFAESGSNLQTFIERHGLTYRLNEYKKISSTANRIKNKDKSEESLYQLIKDRRRLAQSFLKKKQSTYRVMEDNESRLDFLYNNQYYPINEISFNDYAAMGIYWAVLAKRTE